MMASFRDAFAPMTEERKMEEMAKFKAWYEKGVAERWCSYCKHVVWIDELEHGNKTRYPWCGITDLYVGGDKGKECFEAGEFRHGEEA